MALAIVEEAVFAEYRLAFRRGDEVDELAGQRRVFRETELDEEQGLRLGDAGRQVDCLDMRGVVGEEGGGRNAVQLRSFFR